MNRSERRRQLRNSRGRLLELEGGPVVLADSKHHVEDLGLPPAGTHMWVTMAMFRIAAPQAERQDLDMENLLTIEGPVCYVCEQAFSEEVAGRRCPGEP